MALGALFVTFGFPFALLLTGEGKIGEELNVVALSCVLGIAISVIICSNVISFGGSLAVALAWCFIVWLAVIIIKRPLILVRRYLWSVGFALVFIASQSLLIGFTKPFDALFGVRIGIDAALYADGAQVMLESTGQSGLAAMSAVSPTSFGPAGLLGHLRWGTPMLMALATKLFGLQHSYQIIMPLMAVMIASAALLVVVLCKQLQLPKWVSLFTGLMVVFNYPLLHLVIEAQWPQAMSIPMLLALVVCWQKESNHRLEFLLTNGLLLAALSLFYGEFLPVVILILVSAEILNIRFKTFAGLFTNGSVVVRSLIIAGILIFPYSIKYLNHLFTLSLSVGYLTPHMVNAAEALGIGSIWTRWQEWFTIEESPVVLIRQHIWRDSAISILVVLTIRWGLFRIVRQESQWSIWMACAGISAALWYRFYFTLDNGYLWSKAITSMSPMLLVLVVYGIWHLSGDHRILNLMKSTLVSAVLAIIVVTAIHQIQLFRLSSRPIYADVIQAKQFLEKNSHCAVLLKERGSTDLGVDMWLRDRVFDYSLTAVFRLNPILGNGSTIDYSLNLDPRNGICAVFDNSEQEINIKNIRLQNKIIFKNEHWVIVDCGPSFDLLAKIGPHEFYKLILNV